MIANNVSSIGNANINAGITNDVIVTVLNPSNIITLIITPKNVEPVSPINILAGGKLCTKKPSVDPNIIRERIMSNPPNLFNMIAIIAIVKKYIELIPAHKPSNPSIRFIAFIVLTMINIVIIDEKPLKLITLVHFLVQKACSLIKS